MNKCEMENRLLNAISQRIIEAYHQLAPNDWTELEWAKLFCRGLDNALMTYTNRVDRILAQTACWFCGEQLDSFGRCTCGVGPKDINDTRKLDDPRGHQDTTKAG
jgi:hypothetical protein